MTAKERDRHVYVRLRRTALESVPLFRSVLSGDWGDELADKLDRRWVLNGLSLAAIAVCVTVVGAAGPGDATALIAASAGFGATSITIYSVAAAHANDFCREDFVVELNASLIFFYSLGAIAAPLAVSEFIAAYGASALFAFIAAVHGLLIVFTLYRMTRRAAARVTLYRYRPRTSMLSWRRRQGDDKAATREPEETP